MNCLREKNASANTAATPGEQVMSEIERAIEKEKEGTKEVIPDDPLLEYLRGVNQILDINYQLQKGKEELELENVKKEYGINKLTDELDHGKIPEVLEFWLGGENERFFTILTHLSPNNQTVTFIDFLASDYGTRIMHENNLFIHTDIGNLYYNGQNTGESFYDFVISQNDTTKKIVNAKLYYGGSFEHYLSVFLASFDADTDARLDTLTNKNIKYLFSRYSDFLLSRGLDLSDIVHTKLSADEIVMEKLQNREWEYLIELLIYKVEKDRDYCKIKTVEDSAMIKDMEHNYMILRRIHNEIYTSIAENFQLYINSIDQAELDEIDADFVSSGLNSIQNVDTATKLMMLFDFFTL